MQCNGQKSRLSKLLSLVQKKLQKHNIRDMVKFCCICHFCAFWWNLQWTYFKLILVSHLGAIHLQASSEFQASFIGLKNWPDFQASSIGLFFRPVLSAYFSGRSKQASSETGQFNTFFSNGCHSQRNRDYYIKPKPDEAQNTKFSQEERSLLTSHTTFENLNFENWPPSYAKKTMMDFHTSMYRFP